MLSLFLRNSFNNIVLSTVLGCFTVTYAVPLNARVSDSIFDVDIMFMYEVCNIMENMWGLEGQNDTDRMYELAVRLKRHIELHLNTTINVSKFFDNISNELVRQGHKIPKKQFEAIQKHLKKKEKQIKKEEKKTQFWASCHVDECDYLVRGHSEDKKESKDKEEEVYIPAQLVFGVTLTLCGLFLMFLPIPVCVTWGERMVASGVVICGNCISNKVDSDHRKEKEKQ